MFKLSILSAVSAGLFALSNLTAAEAAEQPAPAAEQPGVQEAAQPAPAAKAEAPAAEPARSVGEPAPDPASTVNEKESLPGKNEEKKNVTYKGSKLIPYLILTANYATPVFLAETAQKKAGCPVIIVPEALPFPEKGTLLTVRMSGSESLMIRAEDLSKFLADLRPRNVIILGNSDVVPPIYSLAVPASSKLIQVDDRAWKVDAIRLDDLLNTSPAIYHAYRKYNKERMIQAEKAAKAHEQQEAGPSAGN